MSIKLSNQLILFLMFTLITFFSCKKDFLEITDSSELNIGSYVKDLNTMQEFLNGVYVRLSTIYEHGTGAAYPELAADNLKPLLSGTQSLIASYTWTQTPTDKRASLNPVSGDLNLDATWRGHYLIIRACNFIIENIGKYRPENTIKADNMLGQAYAIRALVHFKIVNIFSQGYNFSTDASHPGIPYITTSDISRPVTRQTVKQVYNALIEDLSNAIALLPDVAKDTRIVNKTAAKGLLARVYLYKEDYDLSKELAIEIAKEVPLTMINGGYPNDLFKNKNVNETEVLFQLRPLNHIGDKSRFLGYYLSKSTGTYIATNDIANLLSEYPNDIRMKWAVQDAGIWRVNKFPAGVANEEPAITIAGTSYYPAVIRSSEMFLTAAEASAKTGDEATARTYLDAIRKRANPSIDDMTATGQALIDSIHKERRKELCFEGLRMYDLQRWKLGVHRKDVHPSYPAAKDLSYPNAKAIAPIPLSDVTLAGLIQNLGYQ